MGPDPFAEFRAWYDEATRSGLQEPDAMTLATATPEGAPSARIVLFKDLDDRGIRFFTNYESRKGRELGANPAAALLFYWPPDHQIRMEGRVEKLTEAESDAYFRSRPRPSQLGAWASPQSQVIPDREFLQKNALLIDRRYAGAPVPRPPHWGGYRLVPARIEFWVRGEARLHDRYLYTRDERGGWRMELIAS